MCEVDQLSEMSLCGTGHRGSLLESDDKSRACDTRSVDQSVKHRSQEVFVMSLGLWWPNSVCCIGERLESVRVVGRTRSETTVRENCRGVTGVEGGVHCGELGKRPKFGGVQR